MITINLLPQELRPIKRTPIPYMISGAILIVSVLLVAATFLQDMSQVKKATGKLNDHKQKREELMPVIDEANELAEKKLALSKQVETISEITQDRIIWSEQMYNLSRIALDNLWYHEISVSPRTTTETRQELDANGKMKTVRIRLTKHFLKVEGYVVPGEDGQPYISYFIAGAEDDEEFSKTFTLDPGTEFKDTEFEDNPVREFTIEFLVGHGGGEK